MQIETEPSLRPEGLSAIERVRKLPEALLLAAGYYASRVPVLSELIRRLG